MKSMKRALATLWRDEAGLTTVEYAIAGGVIAAAVAVAFTNLGKAVLAVINNLVDAVTGKTSG